MHPPSEGFQTPDFSHETAAAAGYGIAEVGSQETAERVLGSRLKQLREAAGMPQAGLAGRMVRLGHSWQQTTVAKTEASQRPIRVNEAVDLARIFGIQVSELIGPPANPFQEHESLLTAEAAQRPDPRTLPSVEWLLLKIRRDRKLNEIDGMDYELQALKAQLSDKEREIEAAQRDLEELAAQLDAQQAADVAKWEHEVGKRNSRLDEEG